MIKRGLRITVSFLLAAVFLFLFFRNLDFGEILENVRHAKPQWLAVAVVMQLIHLTLRCLRWRILLAPIKRKIGFYNLFSTTSIGYLVTMVLPLRLGEILRPIMLGQRERISKSGTVATCVLERLMDALSVALLLGVYLLFFLRIPEGGPGALEMGQVRQAGLVLGLGTLAIFPVLYLLVHYRQRLYELVSRRAGGEEAMLPRLLHAFLGGFDAVKGGWVFTMAWIQSIAIWLVITASVWASLEAFDIGLGFADSLLMMALLTIGIAVPTQGGVGTYEYAGKLGLVVFFGVEPNRAAATILVTHLFAVGPVILIGAILLWKEGLSFRSLSRFTGESDAAAQPAGVSK